MMREESNARIQERIRLMSVRMFPNGNGEMIKMNFNVGPSQNGAEVANDIHEALEQGVTIISHRSPRFYELYAKARREIFSYFSLPNDWKMYFLASGSEAMESACRGLIRERSLHFVNGNFSRRAYNFAKLALKDAQIIERPDMQGFSGSQEEVPTGVDCAFFTKTETASGVATSWDYIREFRKANPDVTVVCDVVSVAPTEPLDPELADFYFFGVQKACGLPAGLSVALCSPKALAKAQAMQNEGLDIGANRAITTLEEYAVKDATLDTPNVLQIYLIGKAFERFNVKGLRVIEAETIAKAEQLYNWLEKSDLYYPAVTDKALRARTAVAVGFAEGVEEAPALETIGAARFETGLGYGHLRGTMLRVANFPVHTLADHKELIEALEKVKIAKTV